MLNTSNEKIIIKNANRNVSARGNQNSIVFMAQFFLKVSESESYFNNLFNFLMALLCCLKAIIW